MVLLKNKLRVVDILSTTLCNKVDYELTMIKQIRGGQNGHQDSCI